LNFARLGVHFEKNCATEISGAQYKLSSLAGIDILNPSYGIITIIARLVSQCGVELSISTEK
jgi:hypothetical protein